MTTAEYRVEELIKMLQAGKELYPWQMEILRKNMYKLGYNCHGSDLYCRGCGDKYGYGHFDHCVFKGW